MIDYCSSTSTVTVAIALNTATTTPQTATRSPMCPAAAAPTATACNLFKLDPDTNDGCELRVFNVVGKYLKQEKKKNKISATKL